MKKDNFGFHNGLKKGRLKDSEIEKFYKLFDATQDLLDEDTRKFLQNYETILTRTLGTLNPITPLLYFMQSIEQGTYPPPSVMLHVYEAFRSFLSQEKQTLGEAFTINRVEELNVRRIGNAETDLRELSYFIRMAKFLQGTEPSRRAKSPAEAARMVYEEDEMTSDPETIARPFRKEGWETFFKENPQYLDMF